MQYNKTWWLLVTIATKPIAIKSVELSNICNMLRLQSKPIAFKISCNQNHVQSNPSTILKNNQEEMGLPELVCFVIFSVNNANVRLYALPLNLCY